MPGGQSATRPPLRSTGLVSTVGSHSGTPPPGTEKRSCDASQKPAARGSLCQSPWAFVLWEASDRPTRPTPPWPKSVGWPCTLLRYRHEFGDALAFACTVIASASVGPYQLGGTHMQSLRDPGPLGRSPRTSRSRQFD